MYTKSKYAIKGGIKIPLPREQAYFPRRLKLTIEGVSKIQVLREQDYGVIITVSFLPLKTSFLWFQLHFLLP